MPYSRSDLIAAFRADNPDAAHIDDNHIFAAIAVEDPELAKGVSEATGSGNTRLDSRREASKQEFEQNRSLANTAMAGLHSMGQGITDAARGIVQAPLDIAHTMAQGRGVSAFDIASGAYHGVVDPVTNY